MKESVVDMDQCWLLFYPIRNMVSNLFLICPYINCSLEGSLLFEWLD